MEAYLELISVPAIAAVVYWVINLIKYAIGENETFKRFIPNLIFPSLRNQYFGCRFGFYDFI